MQKNIIIKSKDKKFKIHGVFDGSNGDTRLIIFVHGLTGHKNEHQFYNGAKFFNKHKFATYRFDLYSGEDKGRRLEKCTIRTHTEDLNQVISYFKNKFKKIYLVGHSLGGPTILEADLNNVSKIVLWDPSVNLNSEEDEDDWYYFNKKINACIVSWGPSYIVHKSLFKEWNNFNYDKWIKNCNIPLKIVCAGKGILKKEWKRIFNNFNNKKELVVIKNAGHCFDEEDTEELLFKETLKWFKL